MGLFIEFFWWQVHFLSHKTRQEFERGLRLFVLRNARKTRGGPAPPPPHLSMLTVAFVNAKLLSMPKLLSMFISNRQPAATSTFVFDYYYSLKGSAKKMVLLASTGVGRSPFLLAKATRVPTTFDFNRRLQRRASWRRWGPQRTRTARVRPCAGNCNYFSRVYVDATYMLRHRRAANIVFFLSEDGGLGGELYVPPQKKWVWDKTNVQRDEQNIPWPTVGILLKTHGAAEKRVAFWRFGVKEA